MGCSVLVGLVCVLGVGSVAGYAIYNHQQTHALAHVETRYRALIAQEVPGVATPADVQAFLLRHGLQPFTYRKTYYKPYTIRAVDSRDFATGFLEACGIDLLFEFDDDLVLVRSKVYDHCFGP
jgi:hypothetical protein